MMASAFSVRCAADAQAWLQLSMVLLIVSAAEEASTIKNAVATVPAMTVGQSMPPLRRSEHIRRTPPPLKFSSEDAGRPDANLLCPDRLNELKKKYQFGERMKLGRDRWYRWHRHTTRCNSRIESVQGVMPTGSCPKMIVQRDRIEFLQFTNQDRYPQWA